MARLFTAGFESAIASTTTTLHGESELGWSANTISAVGTASVQTTVARNSGWAAQCNPSGGNYHQFTIGNHTFDQPMYTRAYVRVDDETPSQLLQLFTWRINAVIVGDIVLNTNGTISLRASGTVIGSSAAISPNTWYRLESKIIVPTGGGATSGTLELKIDGSVVATSSACNTGSSVTTTTHRWGHLNSGESQTTVYTDDIAFNDHTGSAQNGYPGAGNVSLLIPTSDNAAGTGWEAPQTTGSDTTNLYDAINNRPPVGVAHSDVDANNLKYIFNAANLAGGTWSDYRANCQTLNAAGAGSTIALSQTYARLSCDSTTGTNDMEIQGQTPSDTAATVTVETAGVAGTEPTGWKSFRTAPTYSPSLTPTTVPVVEATKILTGSTRAHMVDAMGLMVEWTPTDHTKNIDDTAVLRDVPATPQPGFPATSVKDDFERTENPLSQDGNWTNINGTVQTDGHDVDITAGGRAFRGDLGTLTDCEVWATTTGTLLTPVLYLRTDTTSGNGYLLLTTATGLTLQKFSGFGAGTTLFPQATTPIASGDKVGVRATGTTFDLFVKRAADSVWKQVGQVVDSTYSSGKIGIGSPYGDSLTEFGGGSAATAWTQPVDDTASITDASTRKPGVGLSEAPTATDASTRKPGVGLAETPSVTDASTRKPGVGLSEAPSISDAQAKTATHPLADTGALTDADTNAATSALADTAALSDEIDPRLLTEQELDDSANFTDSITVASGVNVAIDDTVAASDEIRLPLRETADDTAALTDAATKATTSPQADTASVTDATSAKSGKGAADTAAATDAEIASVGKGLAETPTATDAASAAATRPLADTASLTDSASEAASYVRTIADTAAIGDTIQTSEGDRVGIDDTAQLADDVTTVHVAHHLLTIDDTAPLTDVAAKKPRHAEAEAMTIDDARAKAIAKTQGDTASLTDAATQSQRYERLDDTVAIAEAISVRLVKQIADAAEADDSIGPVQGLGIADEATLSDEIHRQYIREAFDPADIEITDSAVEVWLTTWAEAEIELETSAADVSLSSSST